MLGIGAIQLGWTVSSGATLIYPVKHILVNDPKQAQESAVVTEGDIDNTINLVVNIGLCLGAFVPILFPGIEKYGRIKTIVFNNVVLALSVLI